MTQGWFTGGSGRPVDTEKVGFCRTPDDRGVQPDEDEAASAEGEPTPDPAGSAGPSPVTVLPPHPWKLRQRRE